MTITPSRTSVRAAGAAALILMCLQGAPCLAATEEPAPVDITLHQMIRANDGTRLAATIWRPADVGQAVPTVMVMTPYVSDETHQRAMRFARAGYAYVSVDVRGRGTSEGHFTPAYGNGPDGASVIRWIRGQDWSDGRVAMRGGSYRGMVQWQVMAEHPEGLVATIPTASVYPGHDVPSPNGIMMSYTARWLAFVSGRTRNAQLFADEDYWRLQYVDRYLGHTPFTELADLAGTNRQVFLDWLDHPAYDEFWKAYNPTPADYAGMQLPILTITGYFDGDQPGALRYYREFMAHAPQSARRRHFLLMGPWTHHGTREPASEVGGLKFPSNATPDMDQLQIDWLNWVLKDGKRPDLLQDEVTYYVMGKGADEWRHAPSLEAMSTGTRKLYLSSPGGDPGSVFDAGELLPDRPRQQADDTYRYDPHELKGRDTLLEDTSERFLVDPRTAYGDQVLVYHSAPLTEPLTIAGQARLVANIAMNVPDTDVAAEIQAILPDGSTLVLGDDAMRARFRDSPQPALVKPGELNRFILDDFFYTVRKLPAGSRLRLVVFPLDSPDWLRNLNTGGRLGHEKFEDARAADVHLKIGGDRASYLELPVQ